MKNNYEHRQLAPWPLAALGIIVATRLLRRGKKRKFLRTLDTR